ncbi:MAG: hypothetical protein C0412_00090 [Flavobacterium sp.]|nr:hypothetical protein [Flavobacterium sp.]
MLTPLNQFICDHCKNIIRNPEEGYLSWIENNTEYGIRIVHNLHSDHYAHTNRKCFPNDPDPLDGELGQFLGASGLGLLTHIMYNKETQTLLSGTWSNFFEIIRRLQIPYYEEARAYFNKANEQGVFSDVNEKDMYTPEFLQMLITKYNE